MDKSSKEVMLKQESEYDKPYHWIWQRNLKCLYNLRNKIAINMSGPVKTKKILDFGCGDCKFTSILIENNAAYIVGADISAKALCFACRLVPGAEFFEISNELPFDKDTFDIVFCLDVLEHISDGKIQSWISEIYRVLKPKGTFIFSVPSKLKYLDEKHFQHYTPEELENLLQEYFENFNFQGYFIKLPLIPAKWIDGLYNRRIIWRLFTPLVKECNIEKALYFTGIGYKKK